jgi:branched-subunit amino acid aminotransferase/4-amino-4-deoxychorismate lyase
MHKFISFNRQIISANDAKISAVSSASLYGKGIFTTIAIYGGKPFLPDKHWRRLRENSVKLNLELVDEETFNAEIYKLIEANKIVNGRMRLTFFDESASEIWSFPTERTVSFLITTADFREVSTINLTVSPYRVNSTSPLANIKSCNYLEQTLALTEAQNRGFDEAVRLNERGEIVSAAMANLFWLKDEKLYTSGLRTGCLAGTTREFILENYECFEVENQSGSLENADDIFLSSSGIGIKRATFGSNNFTFNSDKVFRFLQSLFPH